MRIDRVEHLKAIVGGYFWLPCPNCGSMFGGHESNNGEMLWNPQDPTRGKMTCTDPTCKEQVREINRKNNLPDHFDIFETPPVRRLP